MYIKRFYLFFYFFVTHDSLSLFSGFGLFSVLNYRVSSFFKITLGFYKPNYDQSFKLLFIFLIIKTLNESGNLSWSWKFLNNIKKTLKFWNIENIYGCDVKNFHLHKNIDHPCICNLVGFWLYLFQRRENKIHHYLLSSSYMLYPEFCLFYLEQFFYNFQYNFHFLAHNTWDLHYCKSL